MSHPNTPTLPRRAALKLAGTGAVAALAAGLLGHRATATENAVNPPATAEPLKTEFVYEALVTISPAVDSGQSPLGHRRYIPITGGTFQGPRIKGKILPGGADWQLDRADGVTEVDALYSMQTDDGAVIIVHNRGLASNGWKYLRTSPRFEAPKGPYAWLNEAVFVGSLSGAPQPNAVIIRVFRVI